MTDEQEVTTHEAQEKSKHSHQQVQNVSEDTHVLLQSRSTAFPKHQEQQIHYENKPIQILKILPPKNENFQTKKSDIFHISAKNIDCG